MMSCVRDAMAWAIVAAQHRPAASCEERAV